jgi:hypothetical protein
MVDSDTELQVVESYVFPHEAYLACTALESAGIQAVIADEHIVAMDWFLATAVGGIKIRVRTRDLAAAREFLAAVTEASRARRASEREPCPHCGSSNIDRVTTGGGLAFLSWLLVGAPLFPLRRRLHCHDCGYLGVPTRTSTTDAAAAGGSLDHDGEDSDSRPDPDDTEHEP